MSVITFSCNWPMQRIKRNPLIGALPRGLLALSRMGTPAIREDPMTNRFMELSLAPLRCKLS